MTATPAQAIAWSKKQRTGWRGLCLVFVRNCYGIGARYPSAAAEWASNPSQHRTSSTNGVPKGAPVHFYTPATKYGHVALYLGGGKFRTNYSARGTIVTATLGRGALYGMTMLGWSEHVNGVRVLPAASSAGKYRSLKKGSRGNDVKAVQRALRKHRYTKQRVTGYFWTQTHFNICHYQRNNGLVEDGMAGPITQKSLGL